MSDFLMVGQLLVDTFHLVLSFLLLRNDNPISTKASLIHIVDIAAQHLVVVASSESDVVGVPYQRH